MENSWRNTFSYFVMASVHKNESDMLILKCIQFYFLFFKVLLSGAVNVKFEVLRFFPPKLRDIDV